MAFILISSYTYSDTRATTSSTISNQDQNQNSTTLTQQQVGTQTVQEVTSEQLFGNQHFEPPSGILIQPNTLVWTNFQLNDTTNAFVSASIFLFPFPNAVGANITVAIYLNGIFTGSSTTPVQNSSYGIQSSSVPTPTSANSVFALTGLVPTLGVGTQSSFALNINGAIITVAITSDKPIWLAGWTQADMSAGTGSASGRSVGQLAGTFEATQAGTSPPTLLPQASTTLTFEFQVSAGWVA